MMHVRICWMATMAGLLVTALAVGRAPAGDQSNQSGAVDAHEEASAGAEDESAAPAGAKTDTSAPADKEKSPPVRAKGETPSIPQALPPETRAFPMTSGAGVPIAPPALVPGPGPMPPPVGPPPRIGFHYTLIPGYGYQVVRVEPHSPAAQLGLHCGDILLALNGHPLTFYGADLEARDLSAASGGWFTVHVRDAHSGMITTRSANLFGPQTVPAAATVPTADGPAIAAIPTLPGTAAAKPPEKPAAPDGGEKPPASPKATDSPRQASPDSAQQESGSSGTVRR